MLNLNDDMDDLIRQAADEYPLKTGNSDWDRVVVGMGMQSAVPGKPAGRKNYWWLLLLLLSLLIAVPVYFNRGDVQKSNAGLNNLATNETAITKESAGEITHQDKAANGAPAVNMPSLPTNKKSKENQLPSNEHSVITTTAPQKNKDIDISSTTNKRKEHVADKNNASIYNKDDNAAVTKPIAGNTNSGNNTALENSHQPPVTDAKETSMAKQTQQDSIDKEQHHTENAKAPVATAGARENNTNDKTSFSKQGDSTATVKKRDNKRATTTKRNGLYAGAAAAMDITTVKFKKMYNLGYSASFLAGYRFNNHWSVESGLMWDNKSYYSPGKYFNKSRTDIPEVSYVHYLDGTCRMFEVPLNVKYDFNSRKMSGFYISAGLSSYFMKKENYEYHATNTVTGDYYVGSRVYKNSTTNLFSVANISGGYQFIFKNNNSLRIEPYFKVPLRGLGIGKLPFESTGISAAYTLPLH